MDELVMDLGLLDDFTQFPAEVTLDQVPYWLVRTSEGEYRLLLAICPHAGGEIRPLQNTLFCPLHFWTFNSEDGTCLNDPDERLLRRKVRVQDNRLYAVGSNE